MAAPLDLPLSELVTMDRELVRLTRGAVRTRLAFGLVLHHLGRGFREHGFRTFGMYVKERASQSAGYCTESRALARRLEELPAMREALLTGAIGWSMAVLLSRHATPDDERELLEAVRGCSVREVRAALRERGETHPEERTEEEDSLDPFVTIDLPLEGREELLALEGVRLAIEHVNAGSAEPGEWFECLVFEGASSLMDRLDLDPPEVRSEVDAARASRRLARDVMAHAEAGAQPLAAPVFEEVGALEDDELVGLGALALDAVALDAKVVDLAARLASRDLWLGRLLSRFLLSRGWQRLGYASEQHYFDVRLGLARSTARARVTLARRLEWLEDLDAAIARGDVGYEQASLISRVANPDTLDAWVERAKGRTFKHLREEVDAAVLVARVAGAPLVGMAPPSDEEREVVFDFERRVLSGEMIANAVQMSATDSPDADERGEDEAELEVVQMSATPRRWRGSYSVRAREAVVLHFRSLDALYRESGRSGSFAMFCVAAFWREWGEQFRHGNRWKVEVFDRDRHRCTSPVCESRVCTNHHVRYRAHGGGDEADNQITGCDFCHLDGEHGGRLKVRGTRSKLVWVLGRTPILRVEGRVKTAA